MDRIKEIFNIDISCLEITEMLPGILNQLGADSLTHLKRLASAVPGMTSGGGIPDGNVADDDDDEVPDLVENFDEVSKNETATETATEGKTAAGIDFKYYNSYAVQSSDFKRVQIKKLESSLKVKLHF